MEIKSKRSASLHSLLIFENGGAICVRRLDFMGGFLYFEIRSALETEKSEEMVRQKQV